MNREEVKSLIKFGINERAVSPETAHALFARLKTSNPPLFDRDILYGILGYAAFKATYRIEDFHDIEDKLVEAIRQENCMVTRIIFDYVVNGLNENNPLFKFGRRVSNQVSFANNKVINEIFRGRRFPTCTGMRTQLVSAIGEGDYGVIGSVLVFCAKDIEEIRKEIEDFDSRYDSESEFESIPESEEDMLRYEEQMAFLNVLRRDGGFRDSLIKLNYESARILFDYYFGRNRPFLPYISLDMNLNKKSTELLKRLCNEVDIDEKSLWSEII